MPPPTRSPSDMRVFDDDDYERRRGPYHESPCGTPAAHEEAYLEEERRSPEKWRQTLAAWLQGSAIGCANQAESKMRYGELRVTVNPDRTVAAEAHRKGELTEDDRKCVEAEAGRAVQELTGRRVWRAAALDEPLTVYVSLGKWPPLFPPSARFTTDWLAAVRTTASRRQFQQRLPAEVALEDGGCLSIPRRASFDLGLKQWLTAAKPFDNLWQAGAPVQDGVLGGERPGWDELRRAYWLGDQAVLVHRNAADEFYRQIALKEHGRLTFDTTRQQNLPLAARRGIAARDPNPDRPARDLLGRRARGRSWSARAPSSRPAGGSGPSASGGPRLRDGRRRRDHLLRRAPAGRSPARGVFTGGGGPRLRLRADDGRRHALLGPTGSGRRGRHRRSVPADRDRRSAGVRDPARHAAPRVLEREWGARARRHARSRPRRRVHVRRAVRGAGEGRNFLRRRERARREEIGPLRTLAADQKTACGVGRRPVTTSDACGSALTRRRGRRCGARTVRCCRPATSRSTWR